MFTLQDLLELPLMRSTRPKVLAGENFASRQVRWVHTSEIFEIAPLLKGGEVLFTTGLGLVGAPTGAISAYVESLASQDVTALIMEVGRTFVQLPEEFVVSARRHQLPLITMHRVVPFVEFTEVIHPLLIAPEVEGLRRGSQAFRQLAAGMVAGGDVAEIVATAQGIVERPVGLYSPGGQLLAGEPVRDLRPSGQRAELSVGPEPWAYLVAADAGAGTPQEAGVLEVLDVAASAVALRLSQTMSGSPSRTLAVADLLADMMRRHFFSADELASRAAALGFVINPHREMVAFVADLSRAARTGAAAVSRAARRQFGQHLAAEIDGSIVLVGHLRPDSTLEDQLAGLVEHIDDELAASGHGTLVRVVAGPPATSMTGLSTSLSRADEGARLARRLGLPARTVTDRDLGLFTLLTRAVPDVDLEQFVEQQLGPLLQADARSGQRLTETLSAYLEAGRSKTAAAAALGIRRQTMYLRLERIAELLGGVDLASHVRLTALDLAVIAWRMRTSGLTGR